MPTHPVTRVPVAAGPAYAERIQRLHSTFAATLQAEPDNRFNPAAVVVSSDGEKIGYLPPEISRHYFEPLTGTPGVQCPGRRASSSANDNTGVALLLDLTGVRCVP